MRTFLFLPSGMGNYRRSYVPGGTFFFTLVTERRAEMLCTPQARACLGKAFRECRRRWPFQIDALVLLPDHLHAIWTLPQGDQDYPQRWGWIKKEFSKAWLSAGGAEQGVRPSQVRQRRRGIWQRRFWEHTIRDEEDFRRHFDYIHFNPVKHHLVESPEKWPFSTFHRWVKLGVYAPDWGCQSTERMDFEDVSSTAKE